MDGEGQDDSAPWGCGTGTRSHQNGECAERYGAVQDGAASQFDRSTKGNVKGTSPVADFPERNRAEHVSRATTQGGRQMSSLEDDVRKTLDVMQQSAVTQQVMEALAATAGQGSSDAETASAVERALGISAAKLSASDVAWLYRPVVLALVGAMGVALGMLSWA